MKAETKKLIKNGKAAELSALKAQAAEALKANPNDTEAQETIDAINAELESRAEAEPKKVRVRAKNWVLVDGKPWQKDQEGELPETHYKALAWNFTRLAAITLVLLLALCFGGVSQAQVYKASYLSVTNGANSVTNAYLLNGANGVNCAVAANSTSNTYLGVFTGTKWNDFAWQINFKLMSSGTALVGINTDTSTDGTNWLAQPIVNITPNGTTPVTTNQVITLGPIGYWRLNSITNGAVSITNLSFEITTKPSRSGS